jgi:hypothetical protein
LFPWQSFFIVVQDEKTKAINAAVKMNSDILFINKFFGELSQDYFRGGIGKINS